MTENRVQIPASDYWDCVTDLSSLAIPKFSFLGCLENNLQTWRLFVNLVDSRNDVVSLLHGQINALHDLQIGNA